MVDNTDITNPKEEENQEKQQESNRLASFVYDRFITSERARQSDEDRWLLDAELIMQATLDKEEVSEQESKASKINEEEILDISEIE